MRTFLCSLLSSFAAIAVLIAPLATARADNTPPSQAPGAAPPDLMPPPPHAAPLQPSAPAPVPYYSRYGAHQKNAGVAVFLEFLFPGAGSIYAEHQTGAFITWGAMLVGLGLVGWGVIQEVKDDDYDGNYEEDTTSGGELAITLGLLTAVGGRIYGLADAYRATRRYNSRLLWGSGLQGRLKIRPIPMRVQGQTTLGLGMSLRF